MDIFITLIVGIVSHVYLYVMTYEIVHFKLYIDYISIELFKKLKNHL